MARSRTNNGSAGSSAQLGFEAKLWLAADKLRNNMDAAEYTSGRQRVPSECFNTFWLAVPPPAIARCFDKFTAPLMAKIKANSTESRTLATLRDTLLPKLMSGELATSQSMAARPRITSLDKLSRVFLSKP